VCRQVFTAKEINQRKSMIIKLGARIAISLLLIGMVGTTSATTIDFEDNNGHLSDIGNYYSADNVIFGDGWFWFVENINQLPPVERVV